MNCMNVDVPDFALPNRPRVLVCGGRRFSDHATLGRALDAVHAIHGIAELIHGGADGADRLAGEWAERRGVATRVFPADWESHGRAAGPIRNEQMLREGRPDLVIAFPGAHGTSQMIRLARGLGVLVWKPVPFEEEPPKRWERQGLNEFCQNF